MILVKNILFGIGITNATKDEILEYILEVIRKKDKKCYIVTPNPEIVMFAQKNKSFKTILNNAEIALCDGVGLYLAGQLLKKPFKERVTGTDLVDFVCAKVNDQPITVSFLGSKKGVAELTAECLRKKYPGLKIGFAASEWPAANTGQRLNKNLYSDILFVAYGFPKQEEWMSQNVSHLPFTVAMGVGGAFDYISQKVGRAPAWARMLGLEWLYRLLVQPWRWKRQLALFGFLKMTLQEYFNLFFRKDHAKK